MQGDGNYAAKMCYDLVLNGYDDWFCQVKMNYINFILIDLRLEALIMMAFIGVLPSTSTRIITRGPCIFLVVSGVFISTTTPNVPHLECELFELFNHL